MVSKKSFRVRPAWYLIGAFVFVIGALYVGIVLALAPHQGFWSGDAGVKLWQMEAWIASGWRTPWTFYAAANVPFDPYGHFSPLHPPFAVWEGDRVITIYTLPYIFVSSFLLAGGGRLALYAPPLAAGVGALVMVARVGWHISARVAFLSVLVLGVTTSWLFYSVTFWGHTVASLFVWGALVLSLSPLELPPRWAAGIAAGLCLGAAVATRPEAWACVIALAVVMVLWRSRWSSLVWLMVGLGLMGLAGWVYQVAVLRERMGGQIAMNFDPGAFGTALWSARRLLDLSQVVVESRNLGVVVILSGSALILVLVHLYRRLRSDEGRQFGLMAECVGLVLAAAGVLVLLLRGHQPIDLFRAAPVIGLLFLGWAERMVVPRRAWRYQLMTWCVLVIALSVVLGRQSGGWQWGPRYLLPVVGPLVFLAVERWERLDRCAGSRPNQWAMRAALAALVVAGMVTQGMGVVKLWKVRAGNDTLAHVLLRAPAAVIVTDLWFVPQSAPEVYGKMPFLVVHTKEEWGELDERLRAQGVDRVRLVRLTKLETPVAGSVAARWRALADTSVVVPTVPPLTVADYVPRVP